MPWLQEERLRYFKGLNVENNSPEYLIEPGVPDIKMLQRNGQYPSDERIKKGPVAVLVCSQEIPCNPCETACRKGFIEIGDDITNVPRIDKRCSGCGLCLPICPGLAIFILNGAFSDTEGTVTIPYELLPLPEVDDVVSALNRKGEEVCSGRIISVKKIYKDDSCYSLTIAVPLAFIHDVRNIERKDDGR